ncbi:MAG: hypothetical protein LBL18_03935 [Bacteroidales bacterium]|jgi:hypothetical protein|nr:hypothetical protein [Bacteroidales bacterium]
MIDRDAFSEQLNHLPIEEAHSFDLFSKLQAQFPASPILNFYYLKLLQLHQPERYEQIKSQLMLTLLNRDIYHQFELYPYSDRPYAAPSQSETATQPAVQTDDKKATNEEDVINHLIDKFSKDAPKIQADPKLHDMNANYGKTSLEEDNKIITETLADIYANQGYYGKAIKMYKKLALIFPKKSSYFATRILQVKNQQKEAQIKTENHQ